MAAVSVAVALAGCGREAAIPAAEVPAEPVKADPQAPILSGKLFVNEKGELSPELRSLVKRGPEYAPIAEDPQELFDRLQGSMADRRNAAWKLVEQMSAPQTFDVGDTTYQIPLWHTWYEGSSANEEFYSKIELFYARLAACKQASATNRCAKSYEELAAETMGDSAGGLDAKNLANSLTDANLSQPLLQLADPAKNGLGAHLGTGFTLFSPSFVEHLLAQSRGMMNCERDHAEAHGAAVPPPSSTQFSPCISEFPRSAVMVKAQWSRLGVNAALSFHDTSEVGMKALFAEPRWPRKGREPADTSKIYTIESREGTRWGLQSIHFSTKDTREWIWVTLWWDPRPSTDFGQDRPPYIKGVWANYKMCVTTSFNERDPEPWKSYATSAPLLAGSLRANHEALVAANGDAAGDPSHITTWCSNPNLEIHPQNNKTNCVGCHQYAGSWNPTGGELTSFSDTLQPDDPNFPQQGRQRHRQTFLSDFSWGMAVNEAIPARIRAARQRYGIGTDE